MLAAIGAVRQQRTCLGRVTKLGVEYPFKLLAQPRTIHRTRDLHAAVEISRHEVGRGNVNLGAITTTEQIDASVLQKAPDHTGDMNILRIAGDTGQDTADVADYELHLDPGTGGRCQLVDDLSLGDGICLDADVLSLPKAICRSICCRSMFLMPNGETHSSRYVPSSLLTSILRKNAAASSPMAAFAVIRLRSVYMAFVFSL